MWKNVVETNIMIGTHADSLIAEAVVKGITGYDRDLAWEAVLKDATVAPKDDGTTQYEDRQEVRLQPLVGELLLTRFKECRLRSPCRSRIRL